MWRTRIHTVRGMLALMGGDLAGAWAHIDGYEALAEHVSPNDHIESRFATIAARVALAARQFDRARTWVRAAQEINTPELLAAVTVPGLTAWWELEQGDLALATKLADEACAQADLAGMRPHHGAFDALVVSGWCHLAVGDLVAADRLAEQARADADFLGYGWNRIRAGALAAEVQRLTAGPAAALHVIADVRVGIGEPAPGHLAAELDVAAARAHIGAGDADGARLLVARLDDGPRRRLLAARLAAGTEPRDVVDGVLGPLDQWTTAERLEAEVVLASSSGAGTHGRLAAALTEGSATGWVSPFLGHGPAVEAQLRQMPLEDLHPALGRMLSVSERWDADPDLHESLTPRELTILELLPTHLSYSQIGAQLYLSVNTVKGNLKTVYRKLGVGSRADAVDTARRLGLV